MTVSSVVCHTKYSTVYRSRSSALSSVQCPVSSQYFQKRSSEQASHTTHNSDNTRKYVQKENDFLLLAYGHVRFSNTVCNPSLQVVREYHY